MERMPLARLPIALAWLALLAGLTLTLAPTPAAFADSLSKGQVLQPEFHGFVSQGFLYTTANNYLARSKNGSFEFADVAFNVTVPLSDTVRMGMQLFARDLGPLGNYGAKMDWYYLDYRWSDWLGLRAGRVKLPFGLYNDASDADSARNAVLLPQSVYPSQNRDFLLAQTGAELYGYVPLGEVGALDYRLYSGTIFLDITSGGPFTVAELNIPYVVGGRVLWESPLQIWRAGGSLQALRLDARLLLPAQPPAPAVPFKIELPAVLYVGSLEYDDGELLVAGEYSRWFVDIESGNQAVVPNSHTVSERGYLMANYRLRPWLQPGAYYSVFFPNVEKRDGREGVQLDGALTLRFDLTPQWLLKLEGHYVYGTAALNRQLNDNLALNRLTPNWGLFMLKTTAFF